MSNSHILKQESSQSDDFVCFDVKNKLTSGLFLPIFPLMKPNDSSKLTTDSLSFKRDSSISSDSTKGSSDKKSCSFAGLTPQIMEESVKKSLSPEKELSYRNKNLRAERELLLKTTMTDEEAEGLYKRLKYNENSDIYSLKRNWNTEETKLFFYTLAKVLKEKHKTEQELTPKDWNQIAIAIPGRSAEQCMYKWGMTRSPKTRKSAWGEEENVCLLAIVQRRGAKDWRSIADELNLTGTYKRKPKQCRERWHNFLNPDISRQEWSTKDDIFLLECIEEVGKKWSQVAKRLPGRTENSIKNRYNSLIRIEKRKYLEENKEREDLNFSSALSAVFDSTSEEEKLEQCLFITLLQRLRKFNNSKKVKTVTTDPELSSDTTTNASINTQPATPEKVEALKSYNLSILNTSSNFQQPIPNSQALMIRQPIHISQPLMLQQPHRIPLSLMTHQRVIPLQPVVLLPTFLQVLHSIWRTHKSVQRK